MAMMRARRRESGRLGGRPRKRSVPQPYDSVEEKLDVLERRGIAVLAAQLYSQDERVRQAAALKLLDLKRKRDEDRGIKEVVYSVEPMPPEFRRAAGAPSDRAV